MSRNNRRTRKNRRLTSPIALFAVLSDRSIVARVPRIEMAENAARNWTREANQTNCRRNAKRALRSHFAIPRADPNKTRRGNAPVLVSETTTDYTHDGIDMSTPSI